MADKPKAQVWLTPRGVAFLFSISDLEHRKLTREGEWTNYDHAAHEYTRQQASTRPRTKLELAEAAKAIKEHNDGHAGDLGVAGQPNGRRAAASL